MVKIKDFTLASKNLGGTCPPPRALHTSRPLLQCKSKFTDTEIMSKVLTV